MPVIAMTGALVAALFALSGCSGDAEPSAEDPGTASASATPTPEVSEADATSNEDSAQEQAAPDKPVRPAARNTPASRQAFARYVMDSWAYALSTNNAATVSSLSPRNQQCEGCKDLTAELAQRERQGWFVDFPGVEVDRVVVHPEPGVPGTFVATAQVDIPASRSYFEDGSYRNDNGAHKNAEFVVRMRLQAPRYLLLSFQVA